MSQEGGEYVSGKEAEARLEPSELRFGQVVEIRGLHNVVISVGEHPYACQIIDDQEGEKLALPGTIGELDVPYLRLPKEPQPDWDLERILDAQLKQLGLGSEELRDKFRQYLVDGQQPPA